MACLTFRIMNCRQELLVRLSCAFRTFSCAMQTTLLPGDNDRSAAPTYGPPARTRRQVRQTDAPSARLPPIVAGIADRSAPPEQMAASLAPYAGLDALTHRAAPCRPLRGARSWFDCVCSAGQHQGWGPGILVFLARYSRQPVQAPAGAARSSGTSPIVAMIIASRSRRHQGPRR